MISSANSTSRDQLMHSAGTTAFETMAVICPSICYTTITTVLGSFMEKQSDSAVRRFCFEFLLLVFPIILNVTILADYCHFVFMVSAMACMSMVLPITSLEPLPLPEVRDEELEGKDHITNSRATISIISVIAILAVDFLIFPRRFAKTELFGFSLMDVGVGLFIYSNGIVEREMYDFELVMKSSGSLFIIGVIRYFVTRRLSYDVPVIEYGVHWNFFTTLAILKLTVPVIIHTVTAVPLWIKATLILLIHEFLIQTTWHRLMVADTPRDDFVFANKEGLFSLAGCLALHLYSVSFSQYVGLRKKNPDRRQQFKKYAFLSLVTLTLTILFYANFGTSRRMCNAAYCFWVLFIGIYMTGLFYFIGLLVKDVLGVIRLPVSIPLILRAINYNGLLFFLVSNLLTGLINVLFDTLTMGPVTSLGIICFYMLVNCSIVVVLYQRCIKFKL